MGEWQGRIVRDPRIMVGKPTVKGTRLTVELILDLLACRETIESILDNYPQLSREDVLAVREEAEGAQIRPRVGLHQGSTPPAGGCQGAADPTSPGAAAE